MIESLHQGRKISPRLHLFPAYTSGDSAGGGGGGVDCKDQGVLYPDVISSHAYPFFSGNQASFILW